MYIYMAYIYGLKYRKYKVQYMVHWYTASQLGSDARYCLLIKADKHRGLSENSEPTKQISKVA